MLVIKDLYSDISDCFWLFYGSKYNIYKQMKEHYRIIPGEFKINRVLPFSKILDQQIIINNWGTLDFHNPIPTQKVTIQRTRYSDNVE